ncbi:transposase [Candidatus Peregrinibacteria bacterium]|nr:transposase [Candidatus Peregrinibacteria bacterium]
MIARQYFQELQNLPHNNDLTKKYCDRFCGILVVDGKYVNVKGYEQKIPLLWGLDYLSHDIPVFTLAPSESYQSWLKYFGYLKSIRYPLQIVICDDNENIQQAARYIFPGVMIQICQNHFLENIRRDLSVRTEEKYRGLVFDLKRELFTVKLTRPDFAKRAFKLLKKYEGNQIALNVIVRIHQRFMDLTAASLIPHAPTTTNIIESYNSHLQARLKSIKAFQSFPGASKWLNGYILRRRYRKFTDCGKKFRSLNGKTSISQTLKKGTILPLLFI